MNLDYLFSLLRRMRLYLIINNTYLYANIENNPSKNKIYEEILFYYFIIHYNYLLRTTMY